jgi:hypothetical protein
MQDAERNAFSPNCGLPLFNNTMHPVSAAVIGLR